ncbi:AAA ATPase [Mortierella claussenii]|nr:AAA ATPase [Mortierella claussenii]
MTTERIISFLHTRSLSFSDEDVDNAADYPTTPTKRLSNTKRQQYKHTSIPAPPSFLDVDSTDENESPSAKACGRPNGLTVKAGSRSSHQQLQTATPPLTPTRRTSPRHPVKHSAIDAENHAPQPLSRDMREQQQPLKVLTTPKKKAVNNSIYSTMSPSISCSNNTTGLTPSLDRMLKSSSKENESGTRAKGYLFPARLSRANGSLTTPCPELGSRPPLARMPSSTIGGSLDAFFAASRSTSPSVTTSSSTTAVLGFYQDAKALFRRTTEPHRLVGRVPERETIRLFCQNHILSPKAGSLYISGQPGTGKTALLKEILRDMEPEMKKAAHQIKVVTINCMTVKDPRLVYKKMLDELSLTVESSDKDAAVKAVENLVLNGKGKTMFVTILDEVDQLLTKDQDVLYKLFQWSCTEKSMLTLVGIANALDMTDRFLPRLKAKNCEPQLLNFNPYGAAEIKAIIQDRLFSLEIGNSCSRKIDGPVDGPRVAPLIQRAAIELCARKVAAATGDLRKALDICRHTMEMVEIETKKKEKRSLEHDDAAPVSNKRPKIMPLQEISLADLENRIAGGVKVPPYRSRSALSSPALSPPPSPLIMRPAFLDEPSPFNDGPKMTIHQAPRATIDHMKKALASAFGSPMVQKMRMLNVHQKIVLAVMVMKIQAGRTVDCDVGRVFDHYTLVCRGSNKIGPVNRGEYQDLINILEANGLVTLGKAKEERLRKLGLVPRESEVVEAIKGQDILDTIVGKAGIKSDKPDAL